MRNIEIKNMSDNMINRYLHYKNLQINRVYSSNKSKIKKIDHYLWWFKKQKERKSFIILKKKNHYSFLHQIILNLKIINLFTLV